MIWKFIIQFSYHLIDNFFFECKQDTLKKYYQLNYMKIQFSRFHIIQFELIIFFECILFTNFNHTSFTVYYESRCEQKTWIAYYFFYCLLFITIFLDCLLFFFYFLDCLLFFQISFEINLLQKCLLNNKTNILINKLDAINLHFVRVPAMECGDFSFCRPVCCPLREKQENLHFQPWQQPRQRALAAALLPEKKINK